MSDTCSTCRYIYIPDEGYPSTSVCRRYPPVCLSTSGQGAFPAVGSDDWCGEFKVVGGPPKPINTAVPYAAQEGATLQCTMGEWIGSPDAYAYAWSLDGAAISNSKSTYDVTADDVGRTATCVVTASNATGSTDAPPSNAVVIAAPPVSRRR